MAQTDSVRRTSRRRHNRSWRSIPRVITLV